MPRQKIQNTKQKEYHHIIYTKTLPIHPQCKSFYRPFYKLCFTFFFFLIYSRAKGINVSIEHHILGTIFMENFLPCSVYTYTLCYSTNTYITPHIFQGLYAYTGCRGYSGDNMMYCIYMIKNQKVLENKHVKNIIIII